MTYSDPVKRPVDHRRARVVVGEWLRQQDGSPTSQRGRVNAALAEKCFEENARRQDDEDGLWSRLSEAYDVVNGAWYALTTAKARGRLFSSPKDDATKAEIEKEKGLLWHRHDPWRSYELGPEASGYTGVLRDDLAETAGEYLTKPWLRLAALDWIVVDAFVTAETIAFGDHLKERYLNGPKEPMERSLFFMKHKGNVAAIQKAGRRYRPRPYLNLVLWNLVVPAATVAVAFYFDYVKTGFVLAALGLLDLLFVAVKLSIRGVAWAAATPEQRAGFKGQNYALLRKMIDAWRVLEGPVINPTMVREQMDVARKDGAIWNGAAYAIVDRAIAHDPTAWVIMH